jgi:hypothetical protein
MRAGRAENADDHHHDHRRSSSSSSYPMRRPAQAGTWRACPQITCSFVCLVLRFGGALIHVVSQRRPASREGREASRRRRRQSPRNSELSTSHAVGLARQQVRGMTVVNGHTGALCVGAPSERRPKQQQQLAAADDDHWKDLPASAAPERIAS